MLATDATVVVAAVNHSLHSTNGSSTPGGSPPLRPDVRARRRYAPALLIALGATLLRLALLPAWGAATLPYLFYFLAAPAVAWRWRFGPAVLMVGTGAVVVPWTLASGGAEWPSQVVPWLRYVLGSLIVVAAIEAMHRARDHARREREQRLLRERQNATQARLLDLSTDMIVARDERGVITYWNQSASDGYGFTREQAIGQEIHTLLKTEFPEPIDVINATLQRTGRWAGDLTHTRADGTRIIVHCRWTLVPAEDGTRSILESSNDLTVRRRDEQLLAESEAQFRTMADHAPVLIWMRGPDHSRVWLNRRWLEFTGRTIEEELAHDWVQDVHPDDRPRCRHAYETAFASRHSFAVEYRLRRYDGEWRWLIDHGTPLPDHEGLFRGYIGSCIDVTDQRLSAGALQESEARERARAEELQTIMEAVPAVIFIARSPECNVVTGNATANALLRLPSERNVSLSAPPLERPRNFAVYVGGRKLEPHELPVQRAARGEVIRNFEEEVRFDDGTSRFLLGNSQPLHDAAGAVRGAVAAFVDVTERRQAEQALRRSGELLRLAERTAGAGAWELDLRSGKVYWSDECHRLYGTDPLSFAPTFDSWLEQIYEPDRDSARAAAQRAIEHREELNIEFRVQHPALGLRWLWEVGKAEYDDGGSPVRLAGIALDVSARKRAEEQLKSARDDALAASRAKDDFLAALSHELRTPLSPVLLTASEAAADPALAPEVRE
ncbi:MAG TPA: PAS domain S-box protein, partial [Candidatus Synoicihabitans sp.]|nr:PAS domain S-box protein [Candidatus Synoicihabitans sp.]